MNVAVDTTEAAILRRVIRPEQAGWAPEAARAILAMTFPPVDMERMRVLTEKAKKGEVSADEEKELENYRHVGRLLEVMKSKARLSSKATAVH